MINFYNPDVRTKRRETVSSLPKGMDFARCLISQAVHPENQAEQVKYAEARWGENSRPALVTKWAEDQIVDSQHIEGATTTAGCATDRNTSSSQITLRSGLAISSHL
jgi:hypothetical protein